MAHNSPPPDPCLVEEVRRIRRDKAREWRQSLTPEQAQTHRAMVRATSAKHAAKAAVKAKRNKRLFELMVSALTQSEAAESMGLHRDTAARLLQMFWPFPPAAGSRHIAARISSDHLATLREIAGTMHLSPMRVVEELLKANLEQNGFRAKQTLGIGRRSA